MDLRTRACFAIARRLIRPPPARQTDTTVYAKWRGAYLARSLEAFDPRHIEGRDVLDFGCGEGALALFVATRQRARSVVGVDLRASSLAAARAALARAAVTERVGVRFVEGATDSLPFDDGAFDTVLAFDCLEHVMAPQAIVREWFRVLRPGGRVLIEWFPFKGPWGPHMEALIPIPWAHVVFGERALFRTAALVYDLPQFVPRHWDLDERGRKRPNKWRAWSSFREQAYVNCLDIATFERIATSAGFVVARLARRSFGGSWPRRAAGRVLMRLPRAGEYFVSSVCIELERPAGVH